MKDITIQFDHVSKKYRLGRGWYFSIRDEASTLARRLLLGKRAPREEFWALKDVSFEVERGETLSLVGANGAGKSTVLKILSRVTVPTTGTFRVNGKVGALIEIGAGFHPDLTGRENVYLNGAIMGMRRAEIDQKFERIVAFAEVEQFIDTPIKYYSSGMSVRLGFAVAAHIDPEILLVDEVLAVGDAAFQAKCLNKLAELKAQRKTIVLVSHLMPNILTHSTRVLWIDHGKVRACGEPERIVDEYLESVRQQASHEFTSELGIADTPIRITGVSLKNGRGAATTVLEYGSEATVEIAYEVTGRVNDPVIGVTLHDIHGYLLGGLTTRLDGVKLDTSHERGMVRLLLSPVLFTRGAYSLNVAVHDEQIQRYLDFRNGAAVFSVEGPSVSSREVSSHIVYPHRWEVEAGEK